MDQLHEINEKVDGLQRGIATLNKKVNVLQGSQELVLWYVSGEDERFRPGDQRKMSAVKELMVREALAKIRQGDERSQLSICHAVFQKFQGIPGAYSDINSFCRQVNRLA